MRNQNETDKRRAVRTRVLRIMYMRLVERRTLQEISEIFGISSTRAGQLIQRYHHDRQRTRRVIHIRKHLAQLVDPDEGAYERGVWYSRDIPPKSEQ